ncbi:MAG: phosphatase PAP2 family protein [Acidimicrobiales bacterium]
MTPSRRSHLIVAALAFVAFVALFALVAPRNPPGWEIDVVEEATQLPEVVGWPLRLVMQLGRRALVPLLGLAVYLVYRRAPPAIAIVVAGFATGQTVDLLKDWASRARPDGVRVHEDADGLGFPSGHSAVAWALAAVVASQLPTRWRWLPFLVATMVAVARINAGVHYPLDVVGGSLWGLAVGSLVVAAGGIDLGPSCDEPVRPGSP